MGLLLLTQLSPSLTLLGTGFRAVRLDGSIDGTKWASMEEYTLSAGELTATVAVFSVTDSPARYIRGVVTITGTGTVTVYVVGGN